MHGPCHANNIPSLHVQVNIASKTKLVLLDTHTNGTEVSFPMTKGNASDLGERFGRYGSLKEINEKYVGGAQDGLVLTIRQWNLPVASKKNGEGLILQANETVTVFHLLLVLIY